ncbi:MAG TPA: Yip1 family protein [Candidatus Methanoperedens sp.]
MDFVKKVKGFLLKPSKTFDASYGDTLDEALTYFMILTVISSALSTLSFIFTRRGNTGTIFGIVIGEGALSIFMASLIIGIIKAFIIGLILHISVYIMGGRQGITQTMKAYMYGSSPNLLFGWIPILLLGRIHIVTIISAIWSIILFILGINRLHGITVGKAILAILMAAIVASLLTMQHIIQPFF